MNSKTIYIDRIGNVTFTRSNKAKHVNLIVKPLHNVTVSVPLGVPFEKAESIVYHKTDWILDKLSKIKKLEKQHSLFNERSDFHTRYHILEIKPGVGSKISVTISQKKINVKYPHAMDVHSIQVQSAIRKGIERALRIEAKECIPTRTKQLASQFGFSYKEIFFKNAKTRWGSCSGTNNLNFNIHLMRLPDRLIDYVILHELAHTVEKNHSKNFWELLDRLVGDAKRFDKELKKFKIHIF